MFSASKRFACSRAQSTVEAAFALPVLMLLILLLVQPGILLYDRMVMISAASEGCRLYSTASSDVSGTCEDYIRRRLSAIPELDQFHVHSNGCSWNIAFGGGEGSQVSQVEISTEVKPLPLLGSGMKLLGLLNSSGNLVMEVTSTQKTQPDWISNSIKGQNPEMWVGI